VPLTHHTCPQCGAEARPALKSRDINQGLGDTEFQYWRCSGCGTVFLKNVPADLERYYPAQYYSVAGSESELAQWSTRERYKIELVTRFKNKGLLIEVGPGSGGFCYLAEKAGFQVLAIEMDRRASEFLAKTLKIDVVNSTDEAVALRNAPAADVIAMWHVIEHLVDPWAMFEVAAAKLKPGGILVVSAPNPAALQLGVFGGRWVHLDAPRHLWLIPPEVLKKRGQKAGLALRLLTTRDAGSLFWNRFGWRHSLENGLGMSRRLAQVGSYALTLAAAPFERREGHGSAYTLVMEKTA
jgi:SAM-dependent methyltransferase